MNTLIELPEKFKHLTGEEALLQWEQMSESKWKEELFIRLLSIHDGFTEAFMKKNNIEPSKGETDIGAVIEEIKQRYGVKD